MKDSDEQILKRLWRRVAHPRGSVFIEFAAVAPLAVTLVAFAFDFTRILRVEQQLEIGARAMADLETHWVKTKTPGKNGENLYPSMKSKQMVKTYLASTMPGLRPNNFFCKADLLPVPGLSKLLGEGLRFLNPDKEISNLPKIVNIIRKILGTVLDLITLKTNRYFTDVVPLDEYLRVSFSAEIPTLLPRRLHQVIMGLPSSESLGNSVDISQVEQTSDTERVRYYCAMPMMDSATLPPETYGRKIKGFFKKFLPGWLREQLL